MSILDRFAVTDRVAIVTGAGLGIGRGIAVGLAEAGADVVVAARTAADLEEVAEQIRARGRRALVVPTDVTDEAALEHLVQAAVEAFGRLDIAVNNAGGAMPRAAMDTSQGFMARTFHFNVIAPLTLTKLAARQMVETAGGGAVVNISSRSASMTQTSFVAYGAAKAALDPLTRNIAAELAPASTSTRSTSAGSPPVRSTWCSPTTRCTTSSWPAPRCAARASPRTSRAPSSTSCRRRRPG